MSSHGPSTQPPHSSRGRQRLGSPRIVDRNEPVPARLTPKHVGGFSCQRDRFPGWIFSLKTPPAQVEREISRFEDTLRLRLELRLHRDEAVERGTKLGCSAGWLPLGG